MPRLRSANRFGARRRRRSSAARPKRPSTPRVTERPGIREPSGAPDPRPAPTRHVRTRRLRGYPAPRSTDRRDRASPPRPPRANARRPAPARSRAGRAPGRRWFEPRRTKWWERDQTGCEIHGRDRRPAAPALAAAEWAEPSSPRVADVDGQGAVARTRGPVRKRRRDPRPAKRRAEPWSYKG